MTSTPARSRASRLDGSTSLAGSNGRGGAIRSSPLAVCTRAGARGGGGALRSWERLTVAGPGSIGVAAVVLLTALGSTPDDKSAHDKARRALVGLAKSKLKDYCEKVGGSLIWSLPAKPSQ